MTTLLERQDGVCAVGSTIGCTADVVQIAALGLPGKRYIDITLVTTPISVSCKMVLWYFKKSKALWCWSYLQDNIPTFSILILNFLKKVYVILKIIFNPSPSPSLEITGKAFEVIKVIIETAIETVKKGDSIIKYNLNKSF